MGTGGILGIFEAGGIVMYPLLICSVLAVTLATERTIFWLKIYKRQRRVAMDVLNLYESNNIVSALETLKKNIDLPIARIFYFALKFDDLTPEEFRLALETESKVEIPLLKRFNHIFDTIVGLAPLLGLQGTIFGLIKTFSSIQIGNLGATNKAGLTEGISEDLIATSFGLIVGIMTITLASIFRGLYQREIGRIEEYGGYLELFHRRHQQSKQNYEFTERS
ncbi:MotA/TolQ/ExbB proton channel family protein [Chamaesiphon sp.]|uniref:MotA/TolQ/ExbB proton channel family protein n=1 Tax=Chamaesiphon sp. TaxID=2814140 RepID=UPI00359333A0